MILTNEWDQHNGFRHKIENIFWFLSQTGPENNAAYTELKRRKQFKTVLKLSLGCFYFACCRCKGLVVYLNLLQQYLIP